FVSRRSAPVPGSCVTVTMEGSRPLLAEVQSLVAGSGGGGSPRRAVSGLDSQRVAMVNAVVERRGGVRLADADVFAASVGGVRNRRRPGHASGGPEMTGDASAHRRIGRRTARPSGALVPPAVDPEAALRDLLGRIAPGTALRDGLERILAGRTGALIVLGYDRV